MGNKSWFETDNLNLIINNRIIFDGLSLNLNIGEHTVLLGPNGSGKSALIGLINRNLYPIFKTGSYIKLYGSDQVNINNLRSRVSFVTSELERRIYPQSTLYEIVASGFYGSTRLGKNDEPTLQQRTKIRSLLQTLSLDNLWSKVYTELSDGQKRRLLIARALINNPEVLVLDEPTNMLDIRSRHQLITILDKLARNGTTLFQVTHNIETISQTTNRILLLKSGKLIGDGSPSQMLVSSKLSSLFETPLEVVSSKGHWQVFPCSQEN